MSLLSAPQQETDKLLSPTHSLSYRRERKIPVQKKAAPSIGFVMPFQPTMQSISKIAELFAHTLRNVESQISKYGVVEADKIIERIQKLFRGLNYKTHRKSVAILLTPDEEKVIYLDYHIEPLVYVDKSVSIMDLLTNSDHEPDFYLLFLEHNSLKFFEYNTNPQSVINTEKNYPAYCPISSPVLRINNEHLRNIADVNRHASAIINLLNNKHEKPLFITGDQQLVDAFYQSSPHKQLIFRQTCEGNAYTENSLQRLVAEIVVHWDYWQSKFLSSRLLAAQSTLGIICNIDVVSKALSQGEDGILIVDKRLKEHIYHTSEIAPITPLSGNLLLEIENFLQRGNRIIFTDPALLGSLGRIVLLPRKVEDPCDWKLPNNREEVRHNILNKFLFGQRLLF
jgi:hypothetical protein